MIPYKDDNPSSTIPFVTIIIIAANVLVFMYELLLNAGGRELAYSFGAIPDNLLHMKSTQPLSPPATIFTSMFMHGGLFHIAGNMLYLWIFGDNIEDRLGHIRFVFFYLFCGAVSAYANALSMPNSQVPMIGASGAISGVLGAYILLFPRARIHTLVFFGFIVDVIKIPSLIVIGFWAIIQVVSGLFTQEASTQGGIAWFAHVGGFIAGLATIKMWLPRRSKTWS